jgi:hypothetical protein
VVNNGVADWSGVRPGGFRCSAWKGSLESEVGSFPGTIPRGLVSEGDP